MEMITHLMVYLVGILTGMYAVYKIDKKDE